MHFLSEASERILITGATGNVGLETLRTLTHASIQKGYEVVSAMRQPEEVKPDVWAKPDELRRLDFADADAFDALLWDIDRVLLVRPPELDDVDKYFRPFVEAMKRVKVRHVIFLSIQGVENKPLTPHYQIEKLIVESGIPYTFLRSSFFMQNLTTTHQKEIRLRNEIYVPAGKGRTNFVDVRDIAFVAAIMLIDKTGQYLNQSYELTGPEALTYYEVAQILSDVLGRKITYRNPSLLRFLWRKWYHERIPLKFALVMGALYTAAKLGKADTITGEIEQLLQRSPVAFRQFAEDHRTIWIPNR